MASRKLSKLGNLSVSFILSQAGRFFPISALCRPARASFNVRTPPVFIKARNPLPISLYCGIPSARIQVTFADSHIINKKKRQIIGNHYKKNNGTPILFSSSQTFFHIKSGSKPDSFHASSLSS
jgi:hypothetical protein